MSDFNPKALEGLIENSTLKFRRGSQSYIMTCPRCNKKDKLYIRRKDGRFTCFYCATVDNYQGRPEFALRDLLGLPLSELRSTLYGFEDAFNRTTRLDLDFSKSPWDENDIEESPDIPITPFPNDFYALDHQFSQSGANYLESRGVPRDIAIQYGILYHPLTHRVVFPVVRNHKVFGWQARTIEKDVRPKVISSPHLPKSQTVMFWDRLDDAPHAIITEGPIDAIKCHMCGGNIALMGKSYNKQQIEIIMDKGIRKIYLALDPDAGRETGKLAQTIMELKPVCSKVDMFWLTPSPGYKDLGEMSMEDVYQRFLQAPPVHPGTLFF